MTERCFKLLLVLVFLASFLFPSSVSADAGFSPAHPSVEGDAAAFAVYLWDPSCGDRSRSALGLSQSAYDDMVTAAVASGEPVELGRVMPSIGSRASAGCSIALVRVVVTPRAGEGWGAALESARWIGGVRRWGFRGAEHTGRHREFLEALCAMTILRGSDCRATDAEITLASAQAGTTSDLWVPVTYFAKIGNGDASRAELDPAMPSCSLPAARQNPAWGLALWYKGPCGETRPPRVTKPPITPHEDQPAGCSAPMSRDIPLGPVWDASGRVLCHVAPGGARSPLCGPTVPPLALSALPVRADGMQVHAVQVQVGFGFEWRCYEPPASVVGPPEPAAEAPECRFPGMVLKVELAPSASTLACCGNDGAIDLAQVLVAQVLEVLGATECPGGGNSEACCKAIEASTEAAFALLAALGGAGCEQ